VYNMKARKVETYGTGVVTPATIKSSSEAK
jgi:hypothetical protein